MGQRIHDLGEAKEVYLGAACKLAEQVAFLGIGNVEIQAIQEYHDARRQYETALMSRIEEEEFREDNQSRAMGF